MKNALYQELESALAPLGFQLNKALGLLRKSPTGFQSVRVFVEDCGIDSPCFAITLHFSIRIHAVQALTQQYFPIHPRYAHQAPTHTASLGQVVGDPQFRVTIARQEEIDQVFDQVSQYVSTLGVPYLEHYQPVAMLDQLYNDSWQELAVQMKALPVRAIVSMVLAKLTSRPDWQAIAHRLSQEFDHFEASSRDVGKQPFQRLLDELFDYRIPS
ncbi:hypothetical protein [Hymenobacter metallicola]|uniref:DUF4304 domain-containing protein n=1 Tax=Hymenobacter metallicola TaxID=2563114 RepID=A0A4Z0PUN0_9BACT|nr:hypothetical protein [Hymenobacter metallicola]TGE20986.1 hypothetical protein E5K02_24800 [Hymenobacter metallicola]